MDSVDIAILVVCVIFLVGICLYIFLGPGSSRWYR